MGGGGVCGGEEGGGGGGGGARHELTVVELPLALVDTAWLCVWVGEELG